MSAGTDKKLHLTRDSLLELLETMVRIRRFEEKCSELYQQEKIRGFLHLAIGEEAIPSGVMAALNPEDAVVATYREHGHALARGVPMRAVMAEMYGKLDGCARGRGGSMHLFDASKRFYGGYAIVGGGLPLAVGLALADKMRNENIVTACFFGEGAAAEGEFHESLNMAALWNLPVLFICENNLYAMGTALERSESQTDIHAKAASYNLPSQSVDGMDVVAVEAAVGRATADIRAGNGAQFIECHTYRFRPHSMFDPQLYREKAEVEDWKTRDPIPRFVEWLTSAGMIHEGELEAIEADVADEIAEAVTFAEGAPWEEVSDLETFVYAERSVT